MNWLAHLFLSEPKPACRIGNLLPDLVPAPALGGLPADFMRGIRQHRQIDSFTDRHPIVKRSIGRVPAHFRRFGGILVDMFYDHFLSRDWANYYVTPLPVFADEVYSSFAHHRGEIPPEAYDHLERIRLGNFLCSYREMGDLAQVLRRIGLRLRKPAALAEAVSVLENDYAGFCEDFEAFFPELISDVAGGMTGYLRPGT
ncbi:MAG TPA: ACP phosphodiesterase [Candidatus Angelobacter sp.]|nr:ACP phosphodiesterase [Candidatus Angelobacter sp.]